MQDPRLATLRDETELRPDVDRQCDGKKGAEHHKRVAKVCGKHKPCVDTERRELDFASANVGRNKLSKPAHDRTNPGRTRALWLTAMSAQKIAANVNVSSTGSAIACAGLPGASMRTSHSPVMLK